MPKKSDKLWHDLSDESSFYGNDEEVSRLEELVRSNVLESSSAMATRNSKAKAEPAMSETDSASDVEEASPPKERSSRRKTKEKASTSTSPKPASTSEKTSSRRTRARKSMPLPAQDHGPAPEPAKKSAKRKDRTEDPSHTETETDSSTPEPKKKPPTKKRKADGAEPEKKSTKRKDRIENRSLTETESDASTTSEPKKKPPTKKRKADRAEPADSDSDSDSDFAPPPKKKPAQKSPSPESTDSGSPSPSPSREQSPAETEEPEPDPADESTEDPDEIDRLLYVPEESDIVMPRPDVNLLRQRRRNQPMSELIASMPPSTANMHDTGPWIFVNNPHDRGPPAPNPTTFWAEATMDIMGGGSGAPIRRLGGRGSSTEMARTREFMERSILDLARRKGIKTGKWLFFITPDRVDFVWNVIAQATERGELGPSSKVATDDGSGRARMIAVYTKDFDDVADVRRVARKLADLGLIRPHDRPIYYKTDAYTHLEINSGNAWGLKASMYNSRDILAGRF